MAGGCSPGMAKCAATCGHYQIVNGYRQERQRQDIAAENASLGYGEELRDYLRDNPPITFRDYLEQTKRMPEMPENVQWSADMPMAAQWHYLADQDMWRAFEANTPQQANEQLLLGSAMFSDNAVPALAAVGPDRPQPHHDQLSGKVVTYSELRGHPAHEHVARAILEQTSPAARDGVLNREEAAVLGRKYALPPHDAATITDILRERNQLPIEWDPKVPLRTVDPERYGLGAWQTYAPPPQAAGNFAAEVRTSTRQQYLMDFSARAVQLAAGSVDYNMASAVAPDLQSTQQVAMSSVDLAGEARTELAYALIDMPKELDPSTLRPLVENQIPAAAVDTSKFRQADVPKRHQPVQLPQAPQLSAAGRSVLSRRTA